LIKSEIELLLKAEFIRPCKYAEWISNIVFVKKKKGSTKIRACIDFRDLNGDTAKDEYPMTIANMLASGHKIINFLDGNTWCNRCLWPKKIRLRPRFPARFGWFI
jgi:hypothetical protein